MQKPTMRLVSLDLVIPRTFIIILPSVLGAFNGPANTAYMNVLRNVILTRYEHPSQTTCDEGTAPGSLGILSN